MIRITTVYAWFWSWVPFVRRSEYVRVCEACASHCHDVRVMQAEMKRADGVAADAARVAKVRIADLCDTADILRRELREVKAENDRRGALLLSLNEIAGRINGTGERS